MARPKYKKGEPTARERIEDAFWELLEEMPYEEITLAALTRAAGVNHNTIYYHFDGLEDVAITCANENLAEDLPELMLGGMVAPEDLFRVRKDAYGLFPRIHRLCLLVSPDSPAWLVNHVQEAVMLLWLRSAGYNDWDELDVCRQVNLRFIFSGLLGLLGEYGSKGRLDVIPAFITSDIGRSILLEMQALSKR